MYQFESTLCSADGSTHTESNKLYRKVKHCYRPNIYPRQRPTAKARLEQAALAASAGAGSHTPSTASESALSALAQHMSHSHSGIDEKRPTEKFVTLHSFSCMQDRLQVQHAVVGCKIPRKENSPIFMIFLPPPPLLFPRVNTRLTRRWMKTGASDKKNQVD